MKQIFFSILFMLVCAYMCAAIVFWPELTKSKSAYSDWILVIYHVCPWGLAYLSIKAWYQTFIWRRMSETRNASPTLSRGEYRFDVPQKRVGILELIALSLFLLALFALKEIWL